MADPESRDARLGCLMAAAQGGDAEAYRELLEAITPRVRRWVRRRGGFLGDGSVEDIVQDVLLSLHAARATYDPARPFVPWLMAIVRNRLADHARTYARRGSRELSLEERVTSEGAEAKFSQADPWMAGALARAILVLPEGQRQAITLLKLQELSLKEASVLTGHSVGALKLSTHRAIAALRRALGGSSR